LTTDKNDVDEIRRQMAEIRLNLHNSVQQVVAGAGDVADWRRHIRAHPWLAVSTALAVGYLLVPKRSPRAPVNGSHPIDAATLRALIQEAREQGPAPETAGSGRARSLVGAALGMLAPLAWRAAQSYAVAYLEQWIAYQTQRRHMDAGATPGAAAPPSPAPARPGRRTP
jgi:hypothetical protein